jgi:hypothetical protein
VAYAHARFEFAAAHWDRAATEFRDLAFATPDGDVGMYAAEMYLQSLDMLRAHAERASCNDEIAREGPRLVALYCGAPRRADEMACARLRQALTELTRLR